MRITLPTFSALLSALGVPQGRVAVYAKPMMDALATNGVNTPLRLAHFLAQILHESAMLRYFEEIASGRAYEGRVDLGNVIPGDGVRYKGRGPIQVTGRYNYTQFQTWLDANCPGAINVVAAPECLTESPYAWLSAMWYWTTAKKSNGRPINLNNVADEGDTEEVLRRITRLINGGLNGYVHRRTIFRQAMLEIRDLNGFNGHSGNVEWGNPPEATVSPVAPKPPDPLPSGEGGAAPTIGDPSLFGRFIDLLVRFIRAREPK